MINKYMHFFDNLINNLRNNKTQKILSQRMGNICGVFRRNSKRKFQFCGKTSVLDAWPGFRLNVFFSGNKRFCYKDWNTFCILNPLIWLFHCTVTLTFPPQSRVCVCACVFETDSRWDRMFHPVHTSIHFSSTKPFYVPCRTFIHLPPDSHTHSPFNCDYSAHSSLTHPSLEGYWPITTFFFLPARVCVCTRVCVCAC